MPQGNTPKTHHAKPCVISSKSRTVAPIHQADDQDRALFRIWQIIGDPKRGIEPLLPIGRSTFLAGVKSGKYPAPVKLSERTTAWRKADILAVLESFTTPKER
jgi:predicted DNA-binding transcriptional regulator AlpA